MTCHVCTNCGTQFADMYGWTWNRNLIGNGRAIVDASFERQLDDETPGERAP